MAEPATRRQATRSVGFPGSDTLNGWPRAPFAVMIVSTCARGWPVMAPVSTSHNSAVVGELGVSAPQLLVRNE